MSNPLEDSSLDNPSLDDVSMKEPSLEDSKPPPLHYLKEFAQQIWNDVCEAYTSIVNSNNDSKNGTTGFWYRAAIFISFIMASIALYLAWKERKRTKALDEKIQVLERQKNGGSERNNVKGQEQEHRNYGSISIPPPAAIGTTEGQGSGDTNKINYCILNIVSPDMIEIPKELLMPEWEMFSAPAFADNEAFVRIQFHFLLVNVLNRFIRRELVPREYIHMLADPRTATTSIQMILPSTALAEVVSELENMGIGKMVGMMYACPIQGAMSVSTFHQDHTGEEAALIEAQPHVIRTAMLQPVDNDNASVSTNTIMTNSVMTYGSSSRSVLQPLYESVNGRASPDSTFASGDGTAAVAAATDAAANSLGWLKRQGSSLLTLGKAKSVFEAAAAHAPSGLGMLSPASSSQVSAKSSTWFDSDVL